MKTADTASPWLSTEQLAERWQTTVAAIWKRRNQGKMPPASRFGGRELRFHIDDVIAFENRERRETSG